MRASMLVVMLAAAGCASRDAPRTAAKLEDGGPNFDAQSASETTEGDAPSTSDDGADASTDTAKPVADALPDAVPDAIADGKNACGGDGPLTTAWVPFGEYTGKIGDCCYEAKGCAIAAGRATCCTGGECGAGMDGKQVWCKCDDTCKK
jgi:hypothetical protein